MFSSKIHVLVLEDDPTISLFYGGVLRKEGAEVVSFNGIKPASDYVTKTQLEDIDIVLTDLMLPDGKATSFIQLIRSISKTIPIIVISSEKEASLIIEVMRENVHDYLIKPVQPQDIITKVKYHISKTEMNYQKTIYEKEKIISLEKLLDWYSFKNKAMAGGNFDVQSLHKNLFHILRASLSQGAGFGILVQIIDIIKGMKKTQEGNYILEKEILEILEENASYAKRILDTFTEIEDVIFDRAPMEKVSVEEILEEVEKIKEDVSSFLEIKKQTLSLGKPENVVKFKNKLLINRAFFRKIVVELLMNAMKFSTNNSKVFILVYTEKEKFTLSFINSVESNGSSPEGISNEYRDLIFEPFFRLTKNIYDSYKTLDFGIGLTLVRETINKFGGTIQVSNLRDHTEDEQVSKVEFKVSFPYVSD